jgi:hypothetical protein
MQLPRLEGVAMGTVIWTVDVPAGWETANSDSGLGTGADRRTTLELYRAAAQLSLIRELLRQQRADEQELAAARDRFARGCWLAELALKAGADPLRRAGPQGVTLNDWLAQLRGENKALCREHQLDDVRLESEQHSYVSDTDRTTMPVQGTPISWLAGPDGQPPRVRLVPATARQVRQSVAFSVQWLIVLLIIGVISMSSVLRMALRWLWPEMMLLLGVLGWQVAGPSLPVLFLLALGAGGRLLIFARGIQLLLARTTLATPGGSSVRK